jgi:hypothetical protein
MKDMEALQIIKLDHEKILDQLEELKLARAPEEKMDVFVELMTEMERQSKREETILAPIFAQYDATKCSKRSA